MKRLDFFHTNVRYPFSLVNLLSACFRGIATIVSDRSCLPPAQCQQRLQLGVRWPLLILQQCSVLLAIGFRLRLPNPPSAAGGSAARRRPGRENPWQRLHLQHPCDSTQRQTQARRRRCGPCTSDAAVTSATRTARGATGYFWGAKGETPHSPCC